VHAELPRYRKGRESPAGREPLEESAARWSAPSRAFRPAHKENTVKIFRYIAVAILLTSLLAASDEPAKISNFDSAEYIKLSANADNKKTATRIGGTLSFNNDKKAVEFLSDKEVPAFSIKYDAIKSMLYERTSTPRYVAAILVSPFFLFSHSKKHYLTIQYTDDAGAGQFVSIHLDKKNAREVVATAEAATGKKVEREEEK
jgi:hypothetical protein